MGITFDKEKKVFTLQTKETAYQFKIDSFGYLLHLYYGKQIHGNMDYLLTCYDRGFSGNPYEAGNDRTYSLDALPQEFPSMGTGDFRNTALTVKNSDGTYSCDLRYKSHEIRAGKYSLEGLPAVYAPEEEAETLEIVLEDKVTNVKAVLLYGVLPERDVITRSTRIINENPKTIQIEKAASACLDFVSGKFDLISFYGRHAMERNYQRVPVRHGRLSIGSRRGASSHQYNPAVILADRAADEDKGSCYAMVFVYSGCFEAAAERDQFNQTRVVMGLDSSLFSYPLAQGESLTVPETVMTYSAEGLSGLSHRLHTCFRENLCRGKYKNKERPVLVNSWEADYFRFTGKSILNLAKEAAELGIEMLVLDDGWFGKREDDNTSLGDWEVNEKKLGCTLGELIEKINETGLRFGIWIEPEMISEESELYRKHPDWALRIPGKKPVRGRNQLVLDFSRKEIRDSIFEQICGVLDQGNIEYIKWDMNRSLEDIYSAAAKDQGRVLYDYVIGVYDFLEKLIRRYPDMLIEGCCGGGGRFDAGMLYYTPQIWCSDNTDAVDRVEIQYGTSFIYPACTVGSHVSAVPNHQTGRIAPLHTRGVTAMGGMFGYELNLGILSEEEKDEIRNQVKAYKKFAGLILRGEYYRLSNPQEEETGAWEFVSLDGKEALVSAVMLKIHGNMTVNYIRLRGLVPEAFYKEEKSGAVYSGAALMEAGIPLPVRNEEYASFQMYFTRTEE